MRIGSETVLSTLNSCVDKQTRKISLPEPVSSVNNASEGEDSRLAQIIPEKNSANCYCADEFGAMGGTPLSSGTPISGDSPSQHHTPENTVLPGQEGLHIKLTQQSSLDKQLNYQMQVDTG